MWFYKNFIEIRLISYLIYVTNKTIPLCCIYCGEIQRAIFSMAKSTIYNAQLSIISIYVLTQMAKDRGTVAIMTFHMQNCIIISMVNYRLSAIGCGSTCRVGARELCPVA